MNQGLSQLTGVTIVNYGTINMCMPPTLQVPYTINKPLPKPKPIEDAPEGGVKRKKPISKKDHAQHVVETKDIIEKNKETLQKWTGKSEFSLIYDSDVDGLNAYGINRCVCEKRNVMIIVITYNKYVFGSFTSLPIPTSQKQDEWVKDDKKHFAFTLVNPSKTEPMKFDHVPTVKDSLVISPSNSKKWVVAVLAFFGIKQDDSSYIAAEFTDTYQVPTGITSDLFVGSHHPDTFPVTKVVALKWSNKKAK
ncbi:hypothetical protein EIN_381550 [Entamoeba invadens IP1]|uniref:TLDc domain-containing protein n=1 Tax=Entamoeba invadens IP1 TaxID=370355 RepID=A0A0A1UAT3_ENTIV|nr:hypothetical protein EIN_381550 [Entamoeba invadens IP1]ELP92188.1 hypothetical protein EIN_381550 [Entamoeba invadens IP1]|eukprot:XP_004258959.1 hypothetical protein EIN_381550 [Entamoeba invadens IP1]